MQQEERLIELESRIAHQDHSMRGLSDEIYRLRKKIDQLETTCHFLVEQLREQARASSGAAPGDEPPPHY